MSFTFSDAAAIVSPPVPWAKDNPPWTDCGDPRSPDFGTLFAWPVARGGVLLTFDREGKREALVLFSRAQLGRVVELHGRRFHVNADALPPVGAPDRTGGGVT